VLQVDGTKILCSRCDCNYDLVLAGGRWRVVISEALDAVSSKEQGGTQDDELKIIFLYILAC
jgi:hypothetical protein